jgi:hypothetical protein
MLDAKVVILLFALFVAFAVWFTFSFHDLSGATVPVYNLVVWSAV